MKVDLAIKFGSHEIIIYQKGLGIIAKEPASLAVTPHGKRRVVRAVGSDALKMARENANILVYEPIVNSEVVDEKLAIILIKKILQKNLICKFNVNGIRAVVAIPCGLNVKQIATLKKVLHQAGVSRLKMVTNAECVREYDETLDKLATCCVVDIGKYTTDITILNKLSVIKGRDYYIGGLNMDEALKTYVQDNFNLEITVADAQDLKCKLSTLYENDSYSAEIIGINSEKQYETQKITANEVRVAIKSVYDKICELILEYVNSLKKEQVAEVYYNGVIFSGGACNIQGLYEYASDKLKMPIVILEDPVNAVVLGAAKMLNK